MEEEEEEENDTKDLQTNGRLSDDSLNKEDMEEVHDQKVNGKEMEEEEEEKNGSNDSLEKEKEEEDKVKEKSEVQIVKESQHEEEDDEGLGEQIFLSSSEASSPMPETSAALAGDSNKSTEILAGNSNVAAKIAEEEDDVFEHVQLRRKATGRNSLRSPEGERMPSRISIEVQTRK